MQGRKRWHLHGTLHAASKHFVLLMSQSITVRYSFLGVEHHSWKRSPSTSFHPSPHRQLRILCHHQTSCVLSRQPLQASNLVCPIQATSASIKPRVSHLGTRCKHKASCVLPRHPVRAPNLMWPTQASSASTKPHVSYFGILCQHQTSCVLPRHPLQAPNLLRTPLQAPNLVCPPQTSTARRKPPVSLTQATSASTKPCVSYPGILCKHKTSCILPRHPLQAPNLLCPTQTSSESTKPLVSYLGIHCKHQTSCALLRHFVGTKPHVYYPAM
jgi:hypothetical protein